MKTLSCSNWQNAAGTLRKVSRGQCKTTKPTLQAVLDSMRWYVTEKGRRDVKKLKDFLLAVGLAANNPGGRSLTFNSLLGHAGASGRLYEARVVGECGRAPWVASEDAFRALYNCV